METVLWVHHTIAWHYLRKMSEAPSSLLQIAQQLIHAEERNPYGYGSIVQVAREE